MTVVQSLSFSRVIERSDLSSGSMTWLSLKAWLLKSCYKSNSMTVSFWNLSYIHIRCKLSVLEKKYVSARGQNMNVVDRCDCYVRVRVTGIRLLG